MLCILTSSSVLVSCVLLPALGCFFACTDILSHHIDWYKHHNFGADLVQFHFLRCEKRMSVTTTVSACTKAVHDCITDIFHKVKQFCCCNNAMMKVCCYCNDALENVLVTSLKATSNVLPCFTRLNHNIKDLGA